MVALCVGFARSSMGAAGLTPIANMFDYVSQVRALLLIVQTYLGRKDIVRAAMRSAANLVRLRVVVSTWWREEQMGTRIGVHKFVCSAQQSVRA